MTVTLETMDRVDLDRIYDEDCLEGMKRIPDSSIDLVVTDPPYLMNYRSNRRVKSDKFKHIENDVDSYGLISDYLTECHRIMKDDTAIYVFCSWHKIEFFKKEFEKHFKMKNIIVWNKNNHGSGDLKGSYAPKHEFILYGHKGRSIFREKRIPDVINCDKIPSSKLTHPTEKPTELLDIFIRNSSDKGDTVFDGFSGTGAVAESSILNGRHFYGFEIEKEYADIGNDRIDNALESKGKSEYGS